MRSHSYATFSFRGSWPQYKCVYCGVISTSEKAKYACPDAPEKPNAKLPAPTDAAGEGQRNA